MMHEMREQINQERLARAREQLRGEWSREQLQAVIGLERTETLKVISAWKWAGLVKQVGWAQKARYHWIETETDAAPPPPPPPHWTRRDLGFAAAGVLALVLLLVAVVSLVQGAGDQRSAGGRPIAEGIGRVQAPRTVPTATPTLLPTPWGTPMPSDTQAFYAPDGERYGVLATGTEYRPSGLYGQTPWVRVETQEGTFWTTWHDLGGYDLSAMPDLAVPTPMPTPVVIREYVDRPVYYEVERRVEVPGPVREVEVPVVSQFSVVQPVPPVSGTGGGGERNEPQFQNPEDLSPYSPAGDPINGFIAQDDQP